MEFIVTPESIGTMADELENICKTFVKENPDFYYDVKKNFKDWTIKVTLERLHGNTEDN